MPSETGGQRDVLQAYLGLRLGAKPPGKSRREGERKRTESTKEWACQHGWRMELGPYPLLLNCLLLIDSERGEVVAFSYEPTGDLTRLQHAALSQCSYS